MGVDDGALAVGALIELAHAVLAEKRQVMNDFLQIIASPHVLALSDVGPPCHDGGFYLIRFLFAIIIVRIARQAQNS